MKKIHPISIYFRVIQQEWSSFTFPLFSFPVFCYLPLLFKYEKMLSLEAQCYVQLLQVQGLPFRKSSFSSAQHCLIPCIQSRILANQKEESRCSLGIPDTSFKGLRTRTARRVRRSTWVLKWVPAVARMLWIETQKTQGYHSLSVSSCFMGSLGIQQPLPGKYTKLVPAVCGCT